MGKVVGIDLETTNSVVAVVGKPVVIANAEAADNSLRSWLQQKGGASSGKWRDAKSSSAREIPSTRSSVSLVVTILNLAGSKARYYPQRRS